MLHAMIMAGGSGTRLWPESRKAFPKQLLTFGDSRTLLQKAVDRLFPLVDTSQIRIVTGAHLAESIRTQLPNLPAHSVVVEPCARNTSACIALAALLSYEQDPDAVMVILSADHVITTTEQFQATIAQAAEIVAQNPNKLVTLGMGPTYPAESFGYIERGTHFATSGPIPTWEVRRFREKPSSDVAAAYIETGNFFWNAGIFVWRAKTILDDLGRFAPELTQPVLEIQAAIAQYGSNSAEYTEVLNRVFPQIPSISIDYAVMEPAAAAGDVLVMAAPFSWDDVGSWQAMERIFPKDSAGNTVLATEKNVLLLNSQDNIVRNSTETQLVATFGVSDLAILVTPDAVLVFDKRCEESVREVTKKLKEMGREDLL